MDWAKEGDGAEDAGGFLSFGERVAWPVFKGFARQFGVRRDRRLGREAVFALLMREVWATIAMEVVMGRVVGFL